MTNGKPVNRFRRATAQRLRANTTGAELTLWRHLKRMEMSGTHFRRQVPIIPYIADFACLASRLLIELDGSQHAESIDKMKNDERTRWLESEGYRVIRFWNNDITRNIEGMLDVIHAALYGSRDDEPRALKHSRRRGRTESHPTPARSARRPSPSREG